MAVTNLSKGSSGSEVKKLQKALIEAGYDVGKTGADGVLGKNTEAAIRQYQKDNGLKVDGIAGKNTQGSLYGTTTNNAAKTVTEAPKTNTGSGGVKDTGKDPVAGTPKVEEPKTATNTPVTSPAGFTYGDFSYQSYTPSDTVNQANALIQQQQANKPGAYTPVWQDEADAYLSQYQNRDPFSYDFNQDALYQQYKDQYIQQGQLAMMDTMGQAAAMTGGYGSSYAQTVGQQAYNQQLSQLNEVMPELYGMAYDRYNQEGQDLLTQYSLYMDRENQEYSRYQDNLNNWYAEMDRLTSNYNDLYNRDYNDYLLGYNSAWDEYNTDRSEAFSKWQTQQSQDFTSSENQKDRDFTASENEKSRTEASKNTGTTTTETNTGKNTMSYDDQAKYEKDAQRAVEEKGVAGLYDVGAKMEREGYSDAFITSWMEDQIKKLLPEEEKKEDPVSTDKPILASPGGPDSTWYWEIM